MSDDGGIQWWQTQQQLYEMWLADEAAQEEYESWSASLEKENHDE